MKPNLLKLSMTAFLLSMICSRSSAHNCSIFQLILKTEANISNNASTDTPTVRPEEVSKFVGKIVHVEIYTQNRYIVGKYYVIIAHSYYPDTTKTLLKVKLANEPLAAFKNHPSFMIRVTGRVMLKKGLPHITVTKISDYKSGTTVI
ncbi:hypothetical protein [Mucilaginibacter sp. CSA2-8R]|uniref:hypothetical protein n=1 Tax=Mucilaginibacter sp. CSA2-8R TaxID=3141542 RepID=UPI00315C6D01